MAERTLQWSQERWSFGVDAGEQGPNDRLAPSILKKGCAQLDGLSAELRAADTAPPKDQGANMQALLRPVKHVQRLSTGQQMRVRPDTGMDAQWDIADVHERPA